MPDGAEATSRRYPAAPPTAAQFIATAPPPAVTDNVVAPGAVHPPPTGMSTWSSFDGSLRPLVGRFTGGPTDDIFWYGPGAQPEAFTAFSDAGVPQSLEPLVVHGAYGPIAVGDVDGNGFQDIAWGTASVTNIWSFHDGGYAPSQLSGPNGELRVGFTDPFDLG